MGEGVLFAGNNGSRWWLQAARRTVCQFHEPWEHFSLVRQPVIHQFDVEVVFAEIWRYPSSALFGPGRVVRKGRWKLPFRH